MSTNSKLPHRSVIQPLDYRLRGWSLLFIGFFVVIMGCLLLFMSVIEPDAFIGVPLGRHAGTVLYGICGTGSFIMLLMIFLRVRSQKNCDRAIRFHEKCVTLPKSLNSKERVEIPYTSICRLKFERLSRAATSFITIEYDDTCLRISDMGFETTQDFQAFYSLLAEKRVPKFDDD